MTVRRRADHAGAVGVHDKRPEELRQALVKPRRRAFDKRVTELVSAAQAEGSLRSDIDVRVVERLLFGMINSIVEWYRPGGREDAARLADDVVAVALDGLRVPASARA